MLCRIALQEKEYLLPNLLERLLRLRLRVAFEILRLALQLLLFLVQRLNQIGLFRIAQLSLRTFHLLPQCLNFRIERLQLCLTRSKLDLQICDYFLPFFRVHDRFIEAECDDFLRRRLNRGLLS